MGRFRDTLLTFRKQHEIELFYAFGLGTLVNTCLIVFFSVMAVSQRGAQQEKLNEVQQDVLQQITEQADIKKKQDSILIKAQELRDLIH